MSRRPGKGPSPRSVGCALVVVSSVVTCGYAGLQTTRGLLQYKRFEHTPPGAALEAVADEAKAQGFVEREHRDADDAGVRTLLLVKQNLPPVGSWYLYLHHVDGGVTQVTTWEPD